MTLEEYHEYIIREWWTLAEVLFDFWIPKIPLELLLNYCPVIRPWEFSIASSFLKNKSEIKIIYAVVDYLTPFKC